MERHTARILLLLFVIGIFLLGLFLDAWDDAEIRSPLAPGLREETVHP